MWTFLNANAGAIQAMAAIVTASVTVALVVVTWRYVHLTQRMAEAARAQLIFQQEEEAEKWRELDAQTKLVRALLAALPAQRQAPEWFARSTFSWEPTDVTRLHRLAARLDRKSGEQAAAVVASMTWLADMVRNIKGPDAYEWDKFPWARWEKEIRTAHNGLDAIGEIAVGRLRAFPASRRSYADPEAEDD